MKSTVALIALLSAVLFSLHPAIAVAQSPERLGRPGQSSAAGSKIEGDMTIGNMIVNNYAGLGRKLNEPSVKPEFIAVMKEAVCMTGPTYTLIAYQVAKAVKGADMDYRARLKARDPASLADLSITVLASFDRVSADAIRADEALGPGVYHDAIAAMAFALDACRFFGEEAKL